jgi:hypothetical protein
MTKWIAVLGVVLLVPGCVQTSKPQPGPTHSTAPAQISAHWPSLLNDFRFRWTAEPGIDVTDGPAMVTRAYLESFNVVTFTADINNAYPGFMRATPENQTFADATDLQLTSVRPLGEGYTITPKDARPHFGYVQFHFLELTPNQDGWDAIVCEGNYSNFMESEVQPGKYVSVTAIQETAEPRRNGSNTLESGVHAVRIGLTQHDPRVGLAAPAPVNAPQRGPALAPGQDVFGNWFFTGSSFGGWGPKGDSHSLNWATPDLERRCGEAMPQNEAERLAMITGFKDAPPPHGDAVPGWPLDAK